MKYQWIWLLWWHVALTASYLHKPSSKLSTSTSSHWKKHPNQGNSRSWSSQPSRLSSLYSTKAIPSTQREQRQEFLPRLQEDSAALISWIAEHGGQLRHVEIKPTPNGWILINTHNDRMIPVGEVLLSIPKQLCLFSDTGSWKHAHRLTSSCLQLMQSLPRSAWRVRLAIALLSERVRHDSFYQPYVMNLPFEFRGLPMFFSAAEFRLLQDFPLMAATKARCSFLIEFTQDVLRPLQQKVSYDPFASHGVDVNAFGWGFAAAASRACRLSDETAVLIPGIDIASHSFTPNTILVETEDAFILQTVVEIPPQAAVTLQYGYLSNDDLLADFGFSVDGNPYDNLTMFVDANMINYARSIMGQSNYTDGRDRPRSHHVHSWGDGRRYVSIGTQQDVYHEQGMAPWQQYWLRSLGLYGEYTTLEMTFAQNDATGLQMDPKLRAFFRILYTASEETLVQQGLTPSDMLQPTSMVSLQQEAHVIRSMIGMLALWLRSYGSDVEKDMNYLRYGLVDRDSTEHNLAHHPREGINPKKEKFGQIKFATLRILRNLFRIEHPHPSSTATTESSNSNNKRHLQEEEQQQLDKTLGTLDDILLAARRKAMHRKEETPSLVVTAEEEEEVCELNQYGDSWCTRAEDFQRLDSLGRGLPVNVQEAYKYRIRKKKLIGDLIHSLAQQYRFIEASLGDDLIMPLEECLTLEDKTSRNVKVRELLRDSKQRSTTGQSDETYAGAKALSEKWTSQGIAL